MPVTDRAEFPITKHVIELLKHHAIQSELIVVQHIRQDTYIALSAAAEAGLQLSCILGIDYSVDQEAAGGLISTGLSLEVMSPNEICEAIRDRSCNLPTGRTATIMDVGGYALGTALDPVAADRVVGIVEETNNGLWLYQGIDPLCPVVQIAKCRNKEPENWIVGSAIFDSIRQLTLELNRASAIERIGIMGFGGIGAGVGLACLKRNIQPMVFDIDPNRRMIADAMGCRIPDHGQLLAECDIIVGCTGVPSIYAQDVAKLREGALLFSGSSKNIEFSAVAALMTPVEHKSISVEMSACGHAFVFNEGKPINFRFLSLPLAYGDFLFANNFMAVHELWGRNKHNGVHELSAESQKLVSQIWLADYAGES